MGRQIDDQYEVRLINGYDYHNQAWVKEGRYVPCGHPAKMDCGCFSRIHAGEETKPKTKRITSEEVFSWAQ